MDEKKQIEVPLQFYFNPVECIRMLRYFPYQTTFTNIPYIQNDIYNSDIKIGVMLHLNLDTDYNKLKKQIEFLINHNVNILTFYYQVDKSIEKLLIEYNLEQIKQPNLLWSKEDIGDLNQLDCLYQGLLWGKDKQLDLLVNLDYQLQLNDNCFDQLKQLAINNNGITFGSYKSSFTNLFNDKCFAISVKYWTIKEVMFSLQWLLNNNCTVYLQIWLQQISKILSGNNFSKKYLDYVFNNKITYINSGYIYWKPFNQQVKKEQK